MIAWLALVLTPLEGASFYWQAMADFYQLSDASVPKGLAGGAGEATATDGARWRLGGRGVWREDPKAQGWDRARYFASRRWVADDQVKRLYPDSERGMWVESATGVSHIRFVRMTLEQKAAEFEKRVRARHLRHGLVADSSLGEAGKLASSVTRSTDNDGLWTAIYAAAECFRYAVTKSPEALEYARAAVTAVLDLEPVTGREGLFARSILTAAEPAPRDGMWNWDAARRMRWKGDTSSDEVVGHYLLFGIAWDLIPEAALRKRIEGAVRRVTDHLLDHGLTLTDIHGQPTWWGRWDEEYFESPRGKADAPLNAIEILSFLKTAHHITGEARYEREYRRLALERGYTKIAERYLELREVVNYSDEELAMLSFYPLFAYEREAELKAAYKRAADAWWKNIAREKNPLWIAIYRRGGGDGSVADAVQMLRRIPMDLVGWRVVNSDRTDLEWEPETDRFGRRQSRTLLAPDERPVMKWNGNPFQVDGGNGGASEDDGAFYLLPYWMGRWMGWGE